MPDQDGRHTPIRRHTKIRGDANPYDPEDEQYFERRQDLKMERNLKGLKKLLYLYKRQKGRCPMCGQRITKETKWNTHHLVPRCEGGSDSTDNLVMLHPNCHRQGHSSGFSVGRAGYLMIFSPNVMEDIVKQVEA